MSRSQRRIKGSGKGPGFELWSRRPCNGWGNATGKRMCRRLERARAKSATRKEGES